MALFEDPQERWKKAHEDRANRKLANMNQVETTPAREPFSLRSGLSTFSKEGTSSFKMPSDTPFLSSMAQEDRPTSFTSQKDPSSDRITSPIDASMAPASSPKAIAPTDTAAQPQGQMKKPDGKPPEAKDKFKPRMGMGAATGMLASVMGSGVGGDGGTAPPLSARIKRKKFITKEEGAKLGMGWQARMRANTDQESTYRALSSQDLQNQGAAGTQGLRNVGAANVQGLRNIGAANVQGLQSIGATALQGMRNKGATDIAGKNREVKQKNLNIKNAQIAKAKNIKRLKDKHDYYQGKSNMNNMNNLNMSPEQQAKLQSDAAAASIAYERALGAGTLGESNDQMKKYL